MKLFNINMRGFIFLLLVAFTLIPTYAQKSKRAKRELNRQQLKTMLFDRNLYANNFLWVDKNYLTNDLKGQLERVAYYNELLRRVDTAEIIKPIFTFKNDSITKVVFKRRGQIINIISDTTQNGLIIYYQRLGLNTDKYHVQVGVWKDGLRNEIHYDYNPQKKPSLVVIKYDNGKLINERGVNLKEN